MDWLIIAVAGFLGGALNAVAGGGSFITLSALVYIGVPAISANATGTAALLPGYIVSAWRFRHDVELPANLKLLTIMLIAMVGGSLGGLVLLSTSDDTFFILIPWLILLATAAFVVGPRLIRSGKSEPINTNSTENGGLVSIDVKSRGMTSATVLFIICLYGGYFNGGLGIILLAALGMMGLRNLHGMNGMKNLISAVLTAVAVVVYASGSSIDWSKLLLLGTAAVLGGYFGAEFAYKIPQRILRGFVVLVGIVMAVAFFLQ